jgi:hypothetical protein
MASPLIQRGKVWYLRYTDAAGKRTMKRLSTDKRVAEQLARSILEERDRIRGGWIGPKDLAYRDHEARPLAEHIAEWQADLIARGYTAKHAGQSADRARRLIAVMFGANPDDIDGKRMTRAQQDEARRTIASFVGRRDCPVSRPRRFRPRWRCSGSRDDRPRPATTTAPAFALLAVGAGRQDGCGRTFSSD